LTDRTALHRAGALVGSAIMAVAVVGMPLGVAAKDGDVVRRGSCTARSDWKLKLSPENGRIEVEFEVDQNRNGQTWNVKMKRNGNVFWRGRRTTQPPSGSFEVRRVTRNGAGQDQIDVRARNPRSGEVCRGVASFRS
jgi:hypothetical protein